MVKICEGGLEYCVAYLLSESVKSCICGWDNSPSVIVVLGEMWSWKLNLEGLQVIDQA